MLFLKAGSVALALSATAPTAQAAVVGLSQTVNLSRGSYTFAIGDAASYTFGASDQRGGFFGNLLPSVLTAGTATVASLGAPFYDPPRPTTYFTDEGRRPTFGGQTLAQYLAYAIPAAINAETDSYVGLRFTLADGDHFGFARLAGLSLFEIAYETVAGRAIDARPGPYDALPDVAPVPLPASLPLLALGLGAVGFAARRRAAA